MTRATAQGINHDPLTETEEELLLQLVQVHGPKWTIIAKELPKTEGRRPAQNLKNNWNRLVGENGSRKKRSAEELDDRYGGLSTGLDGASYASADQESDEDEAREPITSRSGRTVKKPKPREAPGFGRYSYAHLPSAPRMPAAAAAAALAAAAAAAAPPAGVLETARQQYATPGEASPKDNPQKKQRLSLANSGDSLHGGGGPRSSPSARPLKWMSNHDAITTQENGTVASHERTNSGE